MRRPAPAPTPRGASAAARLAVAAALAVTAAGCELTTVELTDVVDVVVAEVYLRPGAAAHQALLHRTIAGTGRPVRVDGASILVRGAGGEVLAFEPSPDPRACVSDEFGDATGEASCYVAPDAGFVVPGQAYDLDIALPDGRRLAGRTTVPAAFELVRPLADTCVLEGTSLELAWTRSAGAWAYQADALFTGLAAGLAERGVTDPPDTLRLLGLAVGASDTTIVFPEEFGVFDRFQIDLDVLLALREGLPPGARADLVVAAADRNYVNWVRGGNFNPSGQVRVSSITGDGIGVFGALVGRGRTVVAPGQEAEDAGWPGCGGLGVGAVGDPKTRKPETGNRKRKTEASRAALGTGSPVFVSGDVLDGRKRLSHLDVRAGGALAHLAGRPITARFVERGTGKARPHVELSDTRRPRELLHLPQQRRADPLPLQVGGDEERHQFVPLQSRRSDDFTIPIHDDAVPLLVQLIDSRRGEILDQPLEPIHGVVRAVRDPDGPPDQRRHRFRIPGLVRPRIPHPPPSHDLPPARGSQGTMGPEATGGNGARSEGAG
jgi:hypothetical protein